jgi:hypothetical protein
LTLGPNQFGLRVAAQICLDCRRLKIDPQPPRPKGRDKRDERPPADDRPREAEHRLSALTCCRLEVFAIGHLEHVLTSGGEDAVALAIDGVEIVDIMPNALESVLECLLFMILQAVLADVRLPIRAFRVGAFQLVVTQGPFIEDDQIKARGSF